LKRYIPVALALLLLFGGLTVSRATAGTATDPVITLGYANQKINNTSNEGIKAAWKPFSDRVKSKMTAKKDKAMMKVDSKTLLDNAASRYLEHANGARSGKSAKHIILTLKKGDTVTGGAGTSLILRSGNASAVGAAGRVLINVTKGAEVKPGAAVSRNQNYLLLGADGSGIAITSDTADVAVSGGWRVTPNYKPRYFDLADALNAMRLFNGTPTGYNLQRPTNRLEGLILMIRLLGEENEALAYKGSCPFTDVPSWGKPYVFYAYSKGYTKGASATKFLPNGQLTADHFMTLILRAMGYSDAAGGDFVWNKSLSFAEKIKLFSPAEVALVRNPFYRDQMVYLAYYSLSLQQKGGGGTLLERMLKNGEVSPADAAAAMAMVTRKRPA